MIDADRTCTVAAPVRRRDFIKSAALAALAMPTIVPSSVLGKNGQVAPSNRIVMAGIGLGGRGRRVLRMGFLKQPDVQFVAIADVQEERREIIRRIVNLEYGNEDCVKVRDLQEVLGREDVDAVLITTGDRWHAPASILAARAGKDIYCEKPCSMTVNESMDLAREIQKAGRIFQAGTQRRNVENFQFAVQLAREGKLGKIHTVHAGMYPLFRDKAPLPEEPEPDKEVCDWDAWLGGAPWRPYNKKYVQGRWRGFTDFHAGFGLPEWGAHTVDLCQWAAGMDDTVPVDYESEGDTIRGRYRNGIKLVMRRAGFKGEGNWQVPGTCPVRFEGDAGWVEADDRMNLVASEPSLLAGKPTECASGTDPAKHARDFLDGVKTRRQPACNSAVSTQTHIACHAAAISWELERPLQFDLGSHSFKNDEEANLRCVRTYREPWNPLKLQG